MRRIPSSAPAHENGVIDDEHEADDTQLTSVELSQQCALLGQPGQNEVKFKVSAVARRSLDLRDDAFQGERSHDRKLPTRHKHVNKHVHSCIIQTNTVPSFF